MRLMIILGLSFTKKRLSNKIFKTFYKWEKLQKVGKYVEADKLRDILMTQGII
jgi:cysteinyl-tRNA synthetase